MKIFSRTYIVLVFLLLYAPVFVMILYSFNKGGVFSVFSGFSVNSYGKLFQNSELLNALKRSLLLAGISAIIATVIGTFAALGLDRMRLHWLKSGVKAITDIPMMNPDIVTGVSMMLLFTTVVVGMMHMEWQGYWLGFFCLLIAHVTFCLPYVILSVFPRLRQFDPSLREAALDLGCTPIQSFFKIELPHILPGVLTGLIMSFTLSFDDFVISYFATTSDFQTLPILVYSKTKNGFKNGDDVYALFTIVTVAIFALLLAVNVMGNLSDRNKRKKETN